MTTLQGAFLHKHSEPRNIQDLMADIVRTMDGHNLNAEGETDTLTFVFNDKQVTLQLEVRSELMTYLTLNGEITEEQATVILTQCIACTGQGFIYDPHSTQQPRKRTVIKKNHQLRKRKFKEFATTI